LVALAEKPAPDYDPLVPLGFLMANCPSIDPLCDGKSIVTLLDSMGNSLSVVNDARQSFDSRSDEWSDRDAKLINYLAKHHHTSPFRGVVFKWFVKAPLFIARQWYKHTIASTYVDDQLGWNEKSFRYCSAEDVDFYVPVHFMKQSGSNKQASAGPVGSTEAAIGFNAYANTINEAQAAYSAMLDAGISKEQARGVLPACVYTSFSWTCSLQALLHFISLRTGDGAQGEIAAYAQALMTLGRPVAPEAFDAFAQNNYQF
jgi:thymidylate synthase (FAD)